MDTSFVREFTTEELAELKEETKEKIGQFKKAVKEGIELANQALKEQEETKSFSVVSTFAVNEKIRAIMARCIVTAPIRGRQKDIGEIDVLLFLDPYHDIASLIMLLNGKKAMENRSTFHQIKPTIFPFYYIFLFTKFIGSFSKGRKPTSW